MKKNGTYKNMIKTKSQDVNKNFKGFVLEKKEKNNFVIFFSCIFDL